MRSTFKYILYLYAQALDSPTEALEDYKQVLQLDPQDKTARERAPVLEKQVAAKFEKQKDEMIGTHSKTAKRRIAAHLVVCLLNGVG